MKWMRSFLLHLTTGRTPLKKTCTGSAESQRIRTGEASLCFLTKRADMRGRRSSRPIPAALAVPVLCLIIRIKAAFRQPPCPEPEQLLMLTLNPRRIMELPGHLLKSFFFGRFCKAGVQLAPFKMLPIRRILKQTLQSGRFPSMQQGKPNFGMPFFLFRNPAEQFCQRRLTLLLCLLGLKCIFTLRLRFPCIGSQQVRKGF